MRLGFRVQGLSWAFEFQVSRPFKLGVLKEGL